MVNDYAGTHYTQLDRSKWSWSTGIENDIQEFQALVVRFRSKKVLLKKEGNRWVLPGLLCSRADFSSVFEPTYIIPEIQDLIESDAPLIVLRQSWRRVKSTEIDGCFHTCEKSVVLLEFSEGVTTSESSDLVTTNHSDLRWTPADEAVVFHLVEEAAAVILKELRFIAEEIQPQNRKSWQRPGWFQMATSWMVHQLLTKCDAALTENIIQMRSSHLGVILKAETTKGRFFLKCTSDSGNDAAYTETLARLSPSYVNSPISVDIERQLLLTADYGEILDPCDFAEEKRCFLTSCYAQFQMDAMASVDELIFAGFPDMRVCKLIEHVDMLVSSAVFHSLQKVDETGHDEVQMFRSTKQEIKAELKKLEQALSLRPTVTHNDLWCSNIYWNHDKGNYMFFDFVDSYISHPFASYIGVLNEKQYVKEWSVKTGMSLQELQELLNPGYMCHLLAVLVLRVQEARDVEFPESEESLDEAFRALRLFNRNIQRCLR